MECGEPVPPLILALDIGTSSARAAVFDATGTPLSGTMKRVRYQLHTTSDGGAELDPIELALKIENLLDQVHAATPDQIHAVGVSCFWHSLVGVSVSGQPTTAVTTWADSRARDAAARLRKLLDPGEHHQRTGAYLHPSYPVARLAWLRELEEGAWRATRLWCSFPDWLLSRWTGELVMSLSMASGTGLYSENERSWDAMTTTTLGLDPARDLPPIADSPQQLQVSQAERWPLFAKALWYPAWGDGACSNVGSGAVGVDRVAVMIGTSAAARVLWRGDPLEPPWGLWRYRLDEEYVLIGGALSEGGNIIDWILDSFRLPPAESLWERVMALPVGALGVRWVPTLAGERSPHWPVDAVGMVSGLRLGHDGVVILRAALEAIACRLARLVALIQSARPEVCTVIGSGNALVATRGWPQMIADALGSEIKLAPDPEASLRGAALLAWARSTGQSLSRLARVEVTSWESVVPSQNSHHIYVQLARELQDLEELRSRVESESR